MPDAAPPPHRFASTRWSLVRTASGDDAAGRAALEDLCRAYWYPLYAFARRSGDTADDAADATQGFFASLLEKGWIGQADRERGRFRTFLLAAFRHFRAHERRAASAQKRGGGRRVFRLDTDDAESRFGREPAEGLPPERLFERRFALTLLDRAKARVASAQRSGPPARAERFEALWPFIEGDETPPYEDVASSLGVSETVVKVSIHRLRTKLGDALRVEVKDTLEEGADVDAEIRALIEVLGMR